MKPVFIQNDLTLLQLEKKHKNGNFVARSLLGIYAEIGIQGIGAILFKSC